MKANNPVFWRWVYAGVMAFLALLIIVFVWISKTYS
jgi:hypothetical protein